MTGRLELRRTAPAGAGEDGNVGLALHPRLRPPTAAQRKRRGEGGAGEARRADSAGEETDGALMTRLAAGELRALGDLVDRHQNVLVNYLWRLTKSKERAEEIAQEAFLRIYESASRYRERGAFSAYLFRIATNLLRSEERRRQRWRTLQPMLGWHREVVADEATSPQRHALASEATEQVERALGDLPIHYRAPLVLREIEGWSYADIASALECRVGTVKSRINRGKSQLRERLRPYWESRAPRVEES